MSAATATLGSGSASARARLRSRCSAVAEQHPHDVVRLCEGLGIARALGESERARRVRKCVDRRAAVAGGETAIGVHARVLAAEVDRGLEVELGKIPLAAPVVHASELVLHAREPVAVGESGSGLVRRQRRAVLAAQRVDITGQLVQQRGPGVVVRERRGVVLERLGIGVEQACPLTGGHVGLGGVDRSAGVPVVIRDQRRVSRATLENLGGAAMQQPAPGEASPLEREPAELLVAEVVAVGALDDQPARAELLEPGHRLVLASAARLAKDVEVERAPDHGGCGEQLTRTLRD